MIRALYNSLFVGSGLAATLSIAFVSYTLSGLDGTAGHAGAFSGFLGLGAGLVGFILFTAFAGAAAIFAYLFEDRLPNRVYYKFWLPGLLAIPGSILLVYAASLSVGLNF